jgi:hypothetical protein
MSKFRASDEDIKAFMVAIFPDGAELAMAAFDERYVLQEATRLIKTLRAEADKWLDAFNRSEQFQSPYREELDELRAWRINVTSALRREGGAFYKDVPDHIRALVGDSKRYAELADAVVGPDRLSVEDRDFWTHEMTVKEANDARVEWRDMRDDANNNGERTCNMCGHAESAHSNFGNGACQHAGGCGRACSKFVGDAPKHGIWGNDDAVLEAAKDRAAKKIEAIRQGNSRRPGEHFGE